MLVTHLLPALYSVPAEETGTERDLMDVHLLDVKRLPSLIQQLLPLGVLLFLAC